MNPTFWRGKRVLITGHTGFKGSWLALWLQQCGAEVAGYALPPPPPTASPSLFTTAGVPDGMHTVFGDIRDEARLTALMTEFRPEISLHLAAQALVRESYANPVETYSVNVMGTVHFLEAVRRTSDVKVALVVTSDKCYENREWAWGYRENEPMGGHDPYSSSKGCAELVTAAYRASYFGQEEAMPVVATARAGNVIGGGDWAKDRLIPDIVRALQQNLPVLIRSPYAIRPWQHVLEPLNGYLTLAEHCWENGTACAEGWNFGPNDSDARSVQWIVERMTQLWGEDARWERDSNPHPHEAHYLKLDASKAKMRLGWQPSLDLATTLDWVVEWYREHAAGKDARALTLDQIARYQQKIEEPRS
ncbi:MAG: rfbG [Chthonomonadales bacterium]|nr:rfbG [Chthonomonadales bacterium]